MKKPKKIAYTFVMADLLHYGHIKVLKTAKENADYHICGLISDEACHLWQGINVCNYEERKAVLESLDCVDEIVKQDTMDPTENLKAITARWPKSKLVVVHGDDWRSLPAREYIESVGGKIIQPEYYANLSRDKIINKFKEQAPAHPLGHEYYTHHFRVGNIIQFNPVSSSPLVSTKADTLKNFQSVLKKSSIESIFVCTVGDWKKYKKKIVRSIIERFKGKTLIVRSSSLNEDRFDSSNAGGFESVAEVDSLDQEHITSAINAVISSYKKAGNIAKNDQVLVQSQTFGIRSSGVVFTRDLESNTPYYLINYDDETGRTDTVTGGEGGKGLWLYREGSTNKYPKKWRALMTAIEEIEAHLPGMILDIEFAEKKDGSIVIFQIRPLAANIRTSGQIDDDGFTTLLSSEISRYKKAKAKKDGGNGFLSDMAFWNPSEIIGDNPRPLDYSIYREIITKSAWNKGLTRIGYSEVKAELMSRYGNKPYIDIDHSFLSLIPDKLSKKLKQKLVSFYQKKLKRDLSAHDKIEFEIVLSSLDFETTERLQELKKNGFTDNELKALVKALTLITLNIIKGYDRRLKTDKESLKKLGRARKKIALDEKKFKEPKEFLRAALSLLKDTERLGTVQFTTVAREGFIASALLKSLVKAGAFTTSEVDAFMQSISTVATDFDIDFQRFASGTLNKKYFLKKYGHLRAGTYDITAPRYDQMELLPKKNSAKKKPHVKTTIKKLDIKRFKEVTRGSAFSSIKPEKLLHFIKSSTEERERFKFEFTKSLSLALELLASAGEKLGLKRDDLSYLDINLIRSYEFYDSPEEITDNWAALVETLRDRHENNSILVLPPVIINESSFKVVESFTARPNFITSLVARAHVIDLDATPEAEITGKIVMIKKADPGYDWIFTKKIKGLITKYGGAASHMAIRCAEFNIPAAIGCGERIYHNVSGFDAAELNCKDKKITKELTIHA